MDLSSPTCIDDSTDSSFQVLHQLDIITFIHTAREREQDSRRKLDQHNRKQSALVPVPVLDQCEHFCTTYFIIRTHQFRSCILYSPFSVQTLLNNFDAIIIMIYQWRLFCSLVVDMTSRHIEYFPKYFCNKTKPRT